MMEHFPEHELRMMSQAWQRGWNSACHRFVMDHDAEPSIADEVRNEWDAYDPYKAELDRRADMGLVERNAEVAVGN